MLKLRALGAEMAKELFGRSPETGINLVREFQALGYFERGQRGGSHDDSPVAGSAHAVALFLALAIDRGPRQSVEQAIGMWCLLPMLSTVFLNSPPAPLLPINDPTTPFRSFGHHLNCLVAALRAGLFRSGAPIDEITTGPNPATDLFVGKIQSSAVPMGSATYYEIWTYAMPTNKAAVTMPPFVRGWETHLDISFPAKLAKILGIPERKGDGFIDQYGLSLPQHPVEPIAVTPLEESFLPNSALLTAGAGAR